MTQFSVLEILFLVWSMSQTLVDVPLTCQVGKLEPRKLQVTPKNNHLIMKIETTQQYHQFYIQSHHNLIYQSSAMEVSPPS